MPTNLYRRNNQENNVETASKPGATSTREPMEKPRILRLRIGAIALRAALADTHAAERIWTQLPLFSVAETWGASIHFETHTFVPRDRTARINARPGEIYYWPSDERIILPFGPTPISRPGEIRLPEPCNVIARALDEPAGLVRVTPGEKVSLQQATS